MSSPTAQQYEELGWGLSEQRQSHNIQAVTRGKFGMARLWSKDGVYDSLPEESTVRAVLVVEGVMHGRYDHNDFDVTTGTFVFLDGEEEVRGENTDNCARFYWQFPSQRFASPDIHAMFGEPLPVPDPYGRALISVTNTLLHVAASGSSGPSRAIGRVRDAAELLLLALLDARVDASPRSSDLHRSGLLTEATELIEENFHDPAFTVDALARKLNISRSNLSRLFHSMGTTPYSEILQLRVESATDLLAQTPGARTADVESIAGASGFRSRVHMRRALRRAAAR